jgi:hypothetical protein
MHGSDGDLDSTAALQENKSLAGWPPPTWGENARFSISIALSGYSAIVQTQPITEIQTDPPPGCLRCSRLGGCMLQTSVRPTPRVRMP